MELYQHSIMSNLEPCWLPFVNWFIGINFLNARMCILLYYCWLSLYVYIIHANFS